MAARRARLVQLENAKVTTTVNFTWMSHFTGTGYQKTVQQTFLEDR